MVNLNTGDWIMIEMSGLVSQEFAQVTESNDKYIVFGEGENEWSLDREEFDVIGHIPAAIYSDELARKTQASVFSIIVGESK